MSIRILTVSNIRGHIIVNKQQLLIMKKERSSSRSLKENRSEKGKIMSLELFLLERRNNKKLI